MDPLPDNPYKSPEAETTPTVKKTAGVAAIVAGVLAAMLARYMGTDRVTLIAGGTIVAVVALLLAWLLGRSKPAA